MPFRADCAIDSHSVSDKSANCKIASHHQSRCFRATGCSITEYDSELVVYTTNQNGNYFTTFPSWHTQSDPVPYHLSCKYIEADVPEAMPNTRCGVEMNGHAAMSRGLAST
jgi:hypothetical protein